MIDSKLHSMNTTQDGNPPSHITTTYTKDLHLRHVEAFWEGKLQYNSCIVGWMKSDFPPNPDISPERYRIATPKQLRPWKPNELPLGAWIRTTGSSDVSIAIASRNGLLTWSDGRECYSVNPTHLLKSFEHSTDQGKTWLPCGVLE
jgi:hypothetical protein